MTTYGMERARQILSAGGGARVPRLALKQGDRGRFHFLSSGEDEYFAATRFHTIPDGQYNRDVACLRVLSDGAEVCKFCEEGHDDMSGRFAVWVYVHYILHLYDNPDEDSPPWQQKTLGGRVVFMENVARPLLIWMRPGRQMAWLGQFNAYQQKFGSLLDRMYELKRVGQGRDDTDYTLAVVKEEALDKKTFKELLKELRPVEDVFRETVGYMPKPVKMSEEAPALDEPIAMPDGAAGSTTGAGLEIGSSADLEPVPTIAGGGDLEEPQELV